MDPVKPGAVQEIDLAGRTYVLVPKGDYERMRSECARVQESAAPYGNHFIGGDLRARRKDRGLTLAQVAGRAGIRIETLSRMERGRTNPNLSTVRAVLRALEETAP